MFRLFFLEDRTGFVHIMSANAIYKRVMKDSKHSDYNWKATASELNRICNQKKFPEKYATEIKIAILNCCSRGINKHEIDVHGKGELLEIACIIYNSLIGNTEEKVIKSCANFLKSYIYNVEQSTFEFLFISGESFYKICNEWEKQKFDELFSKGELDFSNLRINLLLNFEETINKAEKEGMFEEDKKKNTEKIERIIEQSVNDFVETYGTVENPKKRRLRF